MNKTKNNMSVLDITAESKITPTELKKRGYWKDGWGSPHTRATKNTTMYETIVEGDLLEWVINYFPPEFEGIVNLGGMRPYDMRGKVLIYKNVQYSHDVFVAPVSSMLDIDVFFDNVVKEKVKPFKNGSFN